MVWEKIGVVGVDSGQLLVCDPCYIDSDWETEDLDIGKSKKHFSYNACSKKTLEKGHGQLKFEMGHDGIGVVSETGLGDGLYEVFANIVEVKRNGHNFGKRVKEIKIKFL